MLDPFESVPVCESMPHPAPCRCIPQAPGSARTFGQIWFVLVLGLIALLPSHGLAQAPVDPPARLWVFLLAGQSNMAGRATTEEIDVTPNPRILVLHDESWFPATEPLHRDKPRVAGVGPGLAFARAILPHLPPDVAIGLVPAAYGGTRIEWWARDFSGEGQRWPDGATLYAHAIRQTRIALRHGSLAGILWNQGESNIGSAHADEGLAYGTALTTLAAHLREDLGHPDAPFVAATLGPWQEARAGAINAVLRSVPGRIPKAASVNTLAPDVKDRLKAKVDDPSHYDAASARLLGELYAEAIRPLLKTAP